MWVSWPSKERKQHIQWRGLVPTRSLCIIWKEQDASRKGCVGFCERATKKKRKFELSVINARSDQQGIWPSRIQSWHNKDSKVFYLGFFVFSKFSADMKLMYPCIRRRLKYIMIHELRIQPRSSEQSLIDTCYSLIEFSLVRKTPLCCGPRPNWPVPKRISTEIWRRQNETSENVETKNDDMDRITCTCQRMKSMIQNLKTRS